MDDTPRLIALLLAGALPLIGLQERLSSTPRGRLVFRLLVASYLLIAIIAGVFLWRRGLEDEAPLRHSEEFEVAARDSSGPPLAFMRPLT